MFIPGGSISMNFLEKMSLCRKLDDALEMTEGTVFREAVEKGIIYFAETGFFHELERFFEEVYIKKRE